jgi:hypothetical protein
MNFYPETNSLFIQRAELNPAMTSKQAKRASLKTAN